VSLEPLIGFLAYLEPKYWLKKQILGKNYSSPTKANPGYFLLKVITQQQIERESCFQPSKNGESVAVGKKKFVSVLDVGFFVVGDMMGVCLCILCLHLDDVIRPWTPTPKAIFDSSFY